MAKSLDEAYEYVDGLYQKDQTRINQARQQRSDSDQQFIDQVNASIDRLTQAAVKPYETQIENLPNEYRKLYDANVVQELVGRRQLQESMANMGLTDSGLNRTQQTALTLQRGNADYDTRMAQQQKTQELQDKIAQLIESGAAQKQQQEAQVLYDSNNWANDLQNTSYNNAASLGAQLYTQDRSLAFQEEQAKLDRENALDVAEQNAIAAQAEADVKASQQTFDNQMAVVSALEAAGASTDDILAYLQSVGLLSSGAATTGTGSSASASAGTTSSSSSGATTAYRAPYIYPQYVDTNFSTAPLHGEYLAAEIASGRMDKYDAVNSIIKEFDNVNEMVVAAKAAGVYNELMSRYN